MHRFIILLLALGSSACATITRGTTETFTIETEPPGATATLSTGQTCITPCTLTLPRSKEFKVTLTKDGYEPQTADVGRKVAGGGAAGMAGNALIGGLIGVGVDASTGAAYDLDPNPLKVTLVALADTEDATAPPAEAADGMQPIADPESVATEPGPEADAVITPEEPPADPGIASEPPAQTSQAPGLGAPVLQANTTALSDGPSAYSAPASRPALPTPMEPVRSPGDP